MTAIATAELDALRERVGRAEAALDAIRRGEVDAVVVRGTRGSEVYTRRGADAGYRVLVERMHEGAATLSADGDLLYCNRRLAELFGRPIDQVIGTPLARHLGAAADAAVARLLADPRGGHATAEVETAGGAAPALPLLLTCNVLPEGSQASFGLIATDLGPQRDAARLRSQRAHLEELVDARTAELRRALAAAEAAAEAKARFLANMSHEIRTPLHAILGLTHLLERDAPATARGGRLRQIGDAGRHLLQLITDILDLSRIDASALTLTAEPFDLAALVRQVLGIVTEPSRAKGLALTAELDPALPERLSGDRTRLLQAMLNLASNAVKFTERGRVALRLQALQQDAASVLLRFSVRDSGPGIPPELRGRLFRPFEQGDSSTTRRHGGSGLGLVIARRLAEAMGGACDCDAAAGGGSEFWFTARLQRAEAATPVRGTAATAEAAGTAGTAGTTSATSADGAAPRVLVVDDDPTCGQITQALLAADGVPAEWAGDGESAIDRVRGGRRYALVLMDMQMPRLDGVATTAALRALPSMRTVPIVALTANAFTTDRDRCLAAGMDDFLAKPVVPALLHETLRRWLPAASDAACRA